MYITICVNFLKSNLSSRGETTGPELKIGDNLTAHDVNLFEFTEMWQKKLCFWKGGVKLPGLILQTEWRMTIKTFKSLLPSSSAMLPRDSAPFRNSQVKMDSLWSITKEHWAIRLERRASDRPLFISGGCGLCVWRFKGHSAEREPLCYHLPPLSWRALIKDKAVCGVKLEQIDTACLWFPEEIQIWLY